MNDYVARDKGVGNAVIDGVGGDDISHTKDHYDVVDEVIHTTKLHVHPYRVA